MIPTFHQDELPGIQDWLRQHYSIQFRNYPVSDDYIESPAPVACEAAV